MTAPATMTVAPLAGDGTTVSTHPASDGAGRALVAIVVDGGRQVPIYGRPIDDVALRAVSLARPHLARLFPPVF